MKVQVQDQGKVSLAMCSFTEGVIVVGNRFVLVYYPPPCEASYIFK
jgi:hypothetical protein